LPAWPSFHNTTACFISSAGPEARLAERSRHPQIPTLRVWHPGQAWLVGRHPRTPVRGAILVCVLDQQASANDGIVADFLGHPASRIEIEGSQWDKETFYTGMYHAFLAPNLYEDVTGEYRGLDSNIHQAKGFKNYAVFSLWDTFRATHPLFSLIQSQRDSDMINSLLAHYDQSVDHLLPLWSLQGNETWCMIGYHAVPVIVDGYLKGVKGFDKERAYQAIRTTAMNPITMASPLMPNWVGSPATRKTNPSPRPRIRL